jgi:Ca-activated chloride channel family protein
MRAAAAVAVAGILLAAAACDDPPRPRVPHLELSATATAGLVLDKDTSQLAIRIRVAAGSLAAEARQPLDLVLVLDTSGSMVGAPIEATRAAAIRLIDRLSPGDRFAVVAFDSTARVVVASTAVTAASRARARKAIGELVARGTTDLAAGLQLGLEQLALGHRAGSIDRIVLSGDGVPNDASSIVHLVERTRQARATITTLGLGADYDEDLLARLAIDTGGGFHYLAEAAAAGAVFDDELVRMQQVVGRNVRVTVRTGPGVTAEPMPGVDDLGTTKVAWLGDLAAGESRDVIIPIAVAGRRAGATIELADVEVVYDDLIGGPPRAETLRSFVSAAASADPAAVAASVKLPLEAARRRALAASTILEAIRRARAGDIAGGLAMLEAAERDTRAAAETLADPELAELADRMVELRKNLAQVAVAGGVAAFDRAAPAATAPAIAADPVAMPTPAEATAYRAGTGGLPPARAPDPAEDAIRRIHSRASHDLRH